MLTHSRIKKAARLQYQIETRRYGTYFGMSIGAGTSCCYDPNYRMPNHVKHEENKESDLEKKAKQSE